MTSSELPDAAFFSDHLRLVQVETVRVEVETTAPATSAKLVNPWRVRESLWQQLSDMDPIPLCLDKPAVSDPTSDVIVVCVLSAVLHRSAADSLERRWAADTPVWVENGIPLRAVLVRTSIPSVEALLEEDAKRPEGTLARRRRCFSNHFSLCAAHRQSVPFNTVVLRSLSVRFFSTGPSSEVDEDLVRKSFGRYGDVKQIMICINAKHPSNFDLYVQFSTREQMLQAYSALMHNALMYSATPFTEETIRTTLLNPRKMLAFFRLDVDRCGVFTAEPLCAQQEGYVSCVHTPVRRCRSIPLSAAAATSAAGPQQQDEASSPAGTAAAEAPAFKRLCVMDRRAPPTDFVRIGAAAPMPAYVEAKAPLSPPPSATEAAHLKSIKNESSPPGSPSSLSSSPSSPASAADSVSSGDLSGRSPAPSSADPERPRKRRRGRISASLANANIVPALMNAMPTLAPAPARGWTAYQYRPRRLSAPNPLAHLHHHQPHHHHQQQQHPHHALQQHLHQKQQQQQQQQQATTLTATTTAPQHQCLEPSETERLRATSRRRPSLATLLSHTDEAMLTRDTHVHDQILRATSAELVTVDMLLNMQQPPMYPAVHQPVPVVPTMQRWAPQMGGFAPPGMMMQQQMQMQQPVTSDERNKRWLDDRWAAFQGRGGLQMC